LISISEESKKRGSYRKWSYEDLTKALDCVVSGQSVKSAAKLHNIPRATLQEKVMGKSALKTRSGQKPLFSEAEERMIVEHAINRASMGIGFTKKNFLRHVHLSNTAYSLGWPLCIW
jgi:hypothetical protein